MPPGNGQLQPSLHQLLIQVNLHLRWPPAYLCGPLDHRDLLNSAIDPVTPHHLVVPLALLSPIQ